MPRRSDVKQAAQQKRVAKNRKMDKALAVGYKRLEAAIVSLRLTHFSLINYRFTNGIGSTKLSNLPRKEGGMGSKPGN